MKLSFPTRALVLVLCLLLAGFADAQGRGKKGKHGGGKKKQQQSAQAKQANKAKESAQKKAKEQQQQRSKQGKEWAEKNKQLAEKRQAAMKANAAVAPEADMVFRKNCASCHVVPDPAQPGDAVWLAGLEQSLCRKLTPDLRDGLSEYLRGPEASRPQALTSHAEPAPGQASIAANIEGEVFLRAEAGGFFRLKWDTGQSGEKRVLAPGKYQLYGYRVHSGGWTISSSGGQRTIALKPDQNLPMRLEPEFELELAARPTHDREQPSSMILDFALRDAHGQTVSVYRSGTRMQIPFRVETDSGPTQHGVMAYGSEGKAEATIEVPVGQAAFARVNLPTLPFPVTGQPRIALPAQP